MKKRSGVIIGKFMPLHRGHQLMIDFARNFTDHLTIMVCSLKREPIPGEIRFEWMKKLFPDCSVIHVTDENPQEPQEHPDFWNIWRNTILSRLELAPDFVFASENYGWKLAESIGAKFIPVDISRKMRAISATEIRRDPAANWQYIPEPVRSYYLKRICIFGPESTGKTTLARALADRYKTLFVAEYARSYLEAAGRECEFEDIEIIARGQIALEDATAVQAPQPLIFCDTDPLTTTIWSNALFQKCPEELEQLAKDRKYDLYLLTDIDVPFETDSQRYFPEKREWFIELCVNKLKTLGRTFVKLSGSHEERMRVATSNLDRLLSYE